VALLLVQVNNAHCRALAGKEQCCGAANTASAPCNESRLAMELFPRHYSNPVQPDDWFVSQAGEGAKTTVGSAST
jgi:hypothetical protein